MSAQNLVSAPIANYNNKKKNVSSHHQIVLEETKPPSAPSLMIIFLGNILFRMLLSAVPVCDIRTTFLSPLSHLRN